MRRFIISAMLAVLPVLAYADAQEARLLRFPSVGGDQIAFTYAGDLYTVSIDGGTAVRLTSDVGYEIFSRFSPDGRTIAFTAQYDGNTEVYTMPAEGGVPKRITYTATVGRDDIGDRVGPNNIVMGWTPDGKSIIYRTRWYAFSSLRGLLFTVHRGQLLLLFSRRFQAGPEPHVPRVPYLEVLPRRSGRRHLDQYRGHHRTREHHE